MIKPAKMPILESQQREIDGYLVCLKAESRYQDWFIIKKESVNKIAAAVQEGGFYTILGPPRSQKSFLLGAIKEKVQNNSDHFCVFLDLLDLFKEEDSKTDESFFKSFGKLFASKVDKPGRDNTHPAFYDINSEDYLFFYLQKLLASIEKNLVILIDHSERIRITPLKSLLNILSKLYNDNQVREGRNISVVTTNSFRTASLVLDADSSFKFSIIEKMGDLSDKAMNIFMDFISSATGIEIKEDARTLCSQYTSGDPYLMSMLCDRVIEKILKSKHSPDQTDFDMTNAGMTLHNVIGGEEITEEIKWFFRNEAIEHRPLHEIIESIEGDPLILIDFLELLKNSGKLPVQNRHKIGVDIDKMELTGAVRIIDSGGQKMYEFRNRIYRCCLDKHFHPKHVVDVLTTAGRWNVAIEHLKHQIESDADDGISCYDLSISRCDNAIRDYIAKLLTKPNLPPMLMQTVINYIYAVDSIQDACNAMIKAMEIAFKRNDYRIYILNPDRSMLKLFSCSEACKAAPEKIQLKGERCNTPEARTCHNKNYYLDKNGILYIPLVIDKIDKKQKLLGLTVLHNFKFKPQNSDSKLLLFFLNQASAALWNVIERETRLQQLKELNMLGKEISRGHLTENQIFEKTAIKISQVYGTVGASVHLLSQTNDPEKCLKQKTESFYCYGALAGNVHEIRPRPSGLTYQVLKYRKPYTLENPEKAPGFNPGMLALGVKACMCLPMISRETIYGVFFVHYNENHSFSQNEIEILTLFANQAAAAFENTRLINQLKTLNIISSDMVKGLKLDALLDSMAEYIVTLLNARRSIFLLFDEQYIYKKRVFNYPDPEELRKELSHKQVMEGLSGEVYRTKKEIMCEDARYHEKNTGSARKKAIKHGTGPIIVAPIKIKEKVIGTLTAANQVGERVFTNNDLELTCMLANQAAIAIDNANLFNETKDIVDFLSHRLKTDVVGSYELIRRAMESGSGLTKKEFSMISESIFAAKTTIDDFSQASITESDNLMSRANFSLLHIKDVIDSSIKSVFHIKTDRLKQDIRVNPRMRISGKSLEHAIVNILENARLYSKPESSIQIIMDELKREPSRLMIKIISQPDKPVDHREMSDFFKKRFRGKNVGNVDGTGLGLFIADKALKMHEGELKVELLADKSIAFALILPLQ